MQNGENSDCSAAVLRFGSKIDWRKIEKTIHNIPEAAGNLAVMPEIQKKFYLKLMQIRLNQAIVPAVEKLRRAL